MFGVTGGGLHFLLIAKSAVSFDIKNEYIILGMSFCVNSQQVISSIMLLVVMSVDVL